MLLKSVAAVYSNFSKMDVSENINKEVVTDGYIEVICYCQWYFNVIWTKLNFGIKFYLLARTEINGLG